MRSGDSDALVVYVTAPIDAADTLARSIVEEQRAACVNIVPTVRSVYRWEGAVEVDEEALLIVKTTTEGLDALIAHVEAEHPYDTPEVIALPIVDGATSYLSWVTANVS